MTITQKALDAYFYDHHDEKELAEKLDEGFDISFGKKHGDKSFWIADPKPHIRERFGLRQEVLVIYSPQPQTDARVLTAIENISRNPDFKHRIDKVLYLLIHKGDTSQALEITKTDPDKVIVIFHNVELLNPQRGNLFVRSRIAQEFGEIDLFGMSSPITADRYFFGRDKLVQELAGKLTTKSQNAGLFGLRKTGKTSVLRAIERRVSVQNYLIEYVDCHNPGIHATRWWQVLENIVERLSRNLSAVFHRNAKLSLNYSISNCGTRFTSDIAELLRHGIQGIILLLDEIEYITPSLSGALGQHWDSDFLPFWQAIRATHQELKGKLVFIVSGVNPASVERTSFDGLPNPIFQLAQPVFLEPFPREAVRSMIRTLGRYAGVKYEEDVYGYLTETYGGHPFLIRLACSVTWKRLSDNDPEKTITISVQDFENNYYPIKERLAQPIRDILLSLVWWYPEEYQLLQMVAQGEGEFVSEYIQSEPAGLFKFVQYGLLKDDKSAAFAIRELHDFLKEHGEQYKKEISPFSRTDMPPELLPEVPDRELLAALFEKRTAIETKLRKTILFYLGVHRNWDNKKISQDMTAGLQKSSTRKKPEELFVGHTPQDVILELFLLDLKEIILANWEVFSGLFENKKSRFAMNMDTINIARRIDAHTKPVTESELSDFKNSYAWIERFLSKVPNL